MLWCSLARSLALFHLLLLSGMLLLELLRLLCMPLFHLLLLRVVVVLLGGLLMFFFLLLLEFLVLLDSAAQPAFLVAADTAYRLQRCPCLGGAYSCGCNSLASPPLAAGSPPFGAGVVVSGRASFPPRTSFPGVASFPRGALAGGALYSPPASRDATTPVAEVPCFSRSRDRRFAVISGSAEFRITAGRLNVLRLRGYGANVPPSRIGFFLRRRTSLNSTCHRH